MCAGIILLALMSVVTPEHRPSKTSPTENHAHMGPSDIFTRRFLGWVTLVVEYVMHIFMWYSVYFQGTHWKEEIR